MLDNSQLQDRIDDLAHKAIGILQVLKRVDTSDVLPTNSISGAAWAAEDIVREIQALATKKGG